MKKVFNDKSTIAHYWANKIQNEARNSNGSFYYYNDTIYSYGSHFPIAKHLEYNGKNCVLFTLRSYSNTTAKHISVVRNASNHLETIYCYYPNGSHNDNFKAFLKDIENISKSLLTARKPQIYINKINEVKSIVERYANFFEIEIPTLLNEALNIVNLETYKSFVVNKETIEKEEKAKELKEQQNKLKKDLKKWYNFETSYLYSRMDKDFLRYNKEKNRFETTQRVEIPFAIAQKFYECLNNNILVVGDKILEYTINYIDKKIIKIGCHTFEISYLNKLAKKHFDEEFENTCIVGIN
jgi:hypothetical protein